MFRRYERLRRALIGLALTLFIAGCSGVPLRSIPKLISLQSRLLDANPADFMIAIQCDQTMRPPAGAAPVLRIAFVPSTPNPAQAFDKSIVLAPIPFDTVADQLPPALTGLRWWVYGFTPASQAELAAVQKHFREARATKGARARGALTISISQEQLAVNEPRYAKTHFESWLQAHRADGFIPMWRGNVAQLLKSG